VALYKAGDARAAREAFATSRRIWGITRGFAEDLLTEDLNVAVTAFRQGDVAAAEAGFAAVRASPLMAAEGAQAETLAALAMIAAKAGDAATARARADAAVTAADALDEPDTLLRTLRSAAEASLLLGDRASAAERLRRAMQIVDQVEAEGAGLLPEDVLGVVVSLLDAAGDDQALARRGIALANDALGDANAWWDVPRLARYVAPLAGDPTLEAGLAVIDAAVRQRVDRAG
jgi:hypothetical protein